MTLPFINNKVVVISSMDALNEGPVHKGEDYADRPYCFFHDYILMRNGGYLLHNVLFTKNFLSKS